MSKNNDNNNNGSTPALGTKANPFTGANAPEDKGARAGKWVKLGNGELVQFGPEGQGPKGNWRGTAHANGATTGKGRRNFPALIHNNNFSPEILNGETAEEHAARLTRFNLGREIIRQVASKVSVKTAATEGGEVMVPLTEAEVLAATKGLKPKEMVAFMLNPSNMHRKVTVEASAGETVTLDKLREGVALAPGEEAKVMETLVSAVQTAIRACPVK